MKGRWIAIAAMATGVGSAGCSKPARAPRPVAPNCPVVVPASVPPVAKPTAAVDPSAALGAVDGERMAVVVLMVPGGGDPNIPKQPHEYKLSLAADADSAAVEVDGQPMGAARVQHLLPAALARLGAHAAAVAPARPAPRPRPVGPDVLPAVRPPRARMMPTNMQPASFVPPPNGAPIID